MSNIQVEKNVYNGSHEYNEEESERNKHYSDRKKEGISNTK